MGTFLMSYKGTFSKSRDINGSSRAARERFEYRPQQRTVFS